MIPDCHEGFCHPSLVRAMEPLLPLSTVDAVLVQVPRAVEVDWVVDDAITCAAAAAYRINER